MIVIVQLIQKAICIYVYNNFNECTIALWFNHYSSLFQCILYGSHSILKFMHLFFANNYYDWWTHTYHIKSNNLLHTAQLYLKSEVSNMLSFQLRSTWSTTLQKVLYEIIMCHIIDTFYCKQRWVEHTCKSMKNALYALWYTKRCLLGRTAKNRVHSHSHCQVASGGISQLVS